jgi:hypothetical protein
MRIEIYNNLPSEIKTTQNFKDFKRKLKDYLLLNAFYSLKEFLINYYMLLCKLFLLLLHELYCFAVLFVSLLLFIHFIFYMIYYFSPFIVLGC